MTTLTHEDLIRADTHTAYNGPERTTINALRTIASALDHPGEAIPVRDYHVSPEADRKLIRVIAGMVRRMALEHMAFNIADRTLTFKWKGPFGE